MQFRVADVVHNQITQEDGRIVRIADLPGHGVCYIVSVAPNPVLGGTAREAIWRHSEMSRLHDCNRSPKQKGSQKRSKMSGQ